MKEHLDFSLVTIFFFIYYSFYYRSRSIFYNWSQIGESLADDWFEAFLQPGHSLLVSGLTSQMGG